MYANGQTLVHKTTGKLARMIPNEDGSAWQWDLSGFISEDGTKFQDDLKNYDCVKDFFGRPYYSGRPGPGMFVDETAKQFLVSEEEREVRKLQLLEKWEQRILDRMDGKNLGPCDIAKERVLCPFADGSKCFEFQKFFLNRRGAKPLFKMRRASDSPNYFNYDGPDCFKYKEQIWIYDNSRSHLIVIENLLSIGL